MIPTVAPVSARAAQWLAISLLPGIGPATLCRLGRCVSSPGSIAGAALNLPAISPRLRAILTDPVALARSRERAALEIARLEQHGFGLICHQDPTYPDRLRSIEDFPVLLFYRGSIDTLTRPMVALVGSRKATSYGLESGHRLAAELAANGITVVSGVAAGIDGAVHGGTLSAGGLTVGVLGCGLDVIYPRNHGRLYDQIAGQGLLLSEYPCTTRPDGFRFPARNRIISGLSLAVVVVEATLKSGSLITARLALDQGREVFAVPGRIDSPTSAGTHRLLRQGALLAESAGDILVELGLDASPAARDDPGHVKETDLDHDTRQVLACLDAYGCDIDAITRQAGLPGGRILEILLQLEMSGLIRQEPGQIYVRTKRS